MQYWDKNGNILDDSLPNAGVVQQAYNKAIAGLTNAKNWLNEENSNSKAYKQKINTALNLAALSFPVSKTIEYSPYLKDIWNGRNLIIDRFFPDADKIKRDGESFYQNFLQKNPANVPGYGEITFSRKNKRKDLTENYLNYPFLRKNLENSVKSYTTNYKQEPDRVYDYLNNLNTKDAYTYIIENIKDAGKKYKMMKKNK